MDPGVHGEVHQRPQDGDGEQDPDDLAADLKRGRLDRYFEIFRRFQTRVDQRIEVALAPLSLGFDFAVKETYRFDRSDAPWAKSKEELDELWWKRVKNDYLGLLLLGETFEAIPEQLLRRYNRLKTRINGFNNSDVAKAALKLSAMHTGITAQEGRLGPGINRPTVDVVARRP